MNISAKSLQDQALPAKVQAALDRWRIDPRFLKIEITESSIMADPAHALAIMSMLQSLGVRLSIDDFGTGYSSLTHLRQLPIDEIKIDQSFVGGMTTSEADASIVRTVKTRRPASPAIGGTPALPPAATTSASKPIRSSRQ